MSKAQFCRGMIKRGFDVRFCKSHDAASRDFFSTKVEVSQKREFWKVEIELHSASLQQRNFTCLWKLFSFDCQFSVLNRSAQSLVIVLKFWCWVLLLSYDVDISTCVFDVLVTKTKLPVGCSQLCTRLVCKYRASEMCRLEVKIVGYV